MSQTHSICSIDGCEHNIHARGWCGKHYWQWLNHGDASHERQTMEERFWSKVYMPPCEDDCWLWFGAGKTARYGRFKMTDRLLGAHCVSYEIANGPIPVGLQIDHLCMNTHCVNPSHLEAVTGKVNTGRWAAQAPERTHCKRGHEFIESNLIHCRNGDRQCRACVNTNLRVRRAKRRASR